MPPRREAILARIAEVFREHGHDGASLARLTEATGLGRGSLYHFFPGGKRQMVEEVLDHVDGWFARHVFGPLRDEPDPERALASMLDRVDDYFRSGRRVCLVGAFALNRSGDAFAGRVGGYFERWLGHLEPVLARRGRADPAGDALRVLVEIQGALVLAAALGRIDPFAATVARLRAELAPGIGPGIGPGIAPGPPAG